MKRVIRPVLFVLALSAGSAAWAIPPGPCTCAGCLLEPDKLCTESFTLEIKPCRDYSAERCPVASASQPLSAAGDFLCALSGELPQAGSGAAEATDPEPAIR